MADQTPDDAAVAAPEIESTPAVAASSLDGADDTTQKRRADDNGATSPRKKIRKHQGDADSSESVDVGEVNSDSESKASASSKQAGQTWNSGITTQLRTSFGSSSKPSKLNAAKPAPKLVPAPEEPSPSDEVAAEVRSELVAAVEAGETKDLPIVEEHGRTWRLPHFKVGFQGGTWDEIFKSMFSQWYAHTA
jgi:hypothetical protein